MYAFVKFSILPKFKHGICSDPSPSDMGAMGTPTEDISHSGRALNGKYLACFSLLVIF
jgi:hypothetical protein